MDLGLVLTYLLQSSVFEHLLGDRMGEGTIGEHLQQREPETQAKLLQVLLRLALVADLDALQRSARSHVSLLLVGELIEQVVADLVLDTSNGNIATDACFGAYMEVLLTCLQAEVLFMMLVHNEKSTSVGSIPQLRPSL